MNLRTSLLVLPVLTLLLAACASATAETTSPTSKQTEADAATELTRADEQGAVTVTVTPLNLTGPADNLNFEIVLDTHSVELDMDLTTLATLSTDTGVSVTPTSWDGSTGGHHVSGVLSFPTALAGTPVLQNAARLTLTIRDVDAPARTFVWELGG